MNRVRAIAILAGGSLLTALFLARFRPGALLIVSTISPAMAACGILLCSLAAGRIALRLVRSNADPVASLLIGYPTFGTLVSLVAWTGMAIQPLIAVMTIGFAAAGAWLLWRDMRDRVASDVRFASPLLLLIPPIAIAFIGAITPVSSPDEMIYKLAVPHAYLQYGAMVELPLNSNSYLALATHGSDLAALAISGGVAAKLSRFGIYLATLAILLRFSRRFAGDCAWWPVTVVAWTPALAIIAGWAWDEWIVIGLAILSLDALERDEIALAFAAAGAAVASKYTGLLWLFAFGVVAAVRLRDARALARGALLAAAFGGFSYVRNLVWTGSPIAPLLLPHSPQVAGYKSEQRFGGWLELARGAEIFDRRIVDESLGILMPLTVLAALFMIRRGDRTLRDLLLVGAIQMPILITLAPVSHNMVLGVIPLSLAGSAACVEIWRASGRSWRLVLGAIAGLALVAQIILVSFVFETYDFTRYLAGRETAKEYIARQQPFAKAYDHLERTMPPGSRVLFLGENRTFHLNRPAMSGGNLDGPRVAAWLESFPSAGDLHGSLRRMGVSHMLLHRGNYRVAGGPPPPMIERELVVELSPRADGMVKEMLKTRATLRYRDETYLIFELR
jgi:hypothetical protein